MKYQKLPVVIEAVQFDGANFDDCQDFCPSLLLDGRKVVIPTLEGVMEVSENDFIIKGVNGEFYPCKPDIFEKTYVKVEE